MDLVLSSLNAPVFDPLFAKLPRLNPVLKDSISIFLVSFIGVNILYFTLSTFSYYFLYDKTLQTNPKYLKDQIRKEIVLSTTSFPITAICTVPWFLFELYGYSKLYTNVDDYGYGYLAVSFILFLMFTDFGVYWIHRFEHHPLLYSWLHKPHHQWKITTPFASFAFHPLVTSNNQDGYFQSLPVHIFVYIFPFNSYLYLFSFVFLQVWTVSIHDGYFATNRIYVMSNRIINSSAHHTVHHLEFNYNYGQYFTLWDRIGGSYKTPEWEFENNMVEMKWRENRGARFEEKKPSMGKKED